MYGQHNKVTKDEVREIESHVGTRLRYRRVMMNHSQTFIAERVGLFFRSSSNMKREQIGLALVSFMNSLSSWMCRFPTFLKKCHQV